MPNLYLPKNSPQYDYAKALWDGVEYEDARVLVGATHSQAENWRRRLRQKAKKATGKPVTLIYALRLVFEGQSQ